MRPAERQRAPTTKKILAGGSPGFRTVLCCFFSHVSRMAIFVSVSCSVAFVSRHTNPFDDAQVIISSTVLAGSTFHHAAGGSLCVSWLCLVFVFVCFCFCLFSVSFGIVDGPIGPCTGPPTARPLLVHLLTKMEEFPTALINGQYAACNSVLIDLAKAKRRWTGKKRLN